MVGNLLMTREVKIILIICFDSQQFVCLVPLSFGYVVEGSDFLSDIKEGDIIVSAKVTDGIEYLMQPKDS